MIWGGNDAASGYKLFIGEGGLMSPWATGEGFSPSSKANSALQAYRDPATSSSKTWNVQHLGCRRRLGIRRQGTLVGPSGLHLRRPDGLSEDPMASTTP